LPTAQFYSSWLIVLATLVNFATFATELCWLQLLFCWQNCNLQHQNKTRKIRVRSDSDCYVTHLKSAFLTLQNFIPENFQKFGVAENKREVCALLLYRFLLICIIAPHKLFIFRAMATPPKKAKLAGGFSDFVSGIQDQRKRVSLQPD